MTLEKQRIAAAKVHGYCDIREYSYIGLELGRKKSGLRLTPIPDYANDLNAVHELEMAQMARNGFQETYLLNLQLVVERSHRDCNNAQLSIWMNCATASQRLEAILWTLNLWEEEL